MENELDQRKGCLNSMLITINDVGFKDVFITEFGSHRFSPFLNSIT